MARLITTVPHNKPARGQKLHKAIALGLKPSAYNKLNKTAELRASSKQRLPKGY